MTTKPTARSFAKCWRAGTWRRRPSQTGNGPCSCWRKATGQKDKPSFALVLLDWMMPAMSGYDVVQAIRQSLPNDPPKIIILSSVAGIEDASSLKDEGVSRILAKPVIQSGSARRHLDGLRIVAKRRRRRSGRLAPQRRTAAHSSRRRRSGQPDGRRQIAGRTRPRGRRRRKRATGIGSGSPPTRRPSIAF